jgi:hypothetical protein
LSTAPTPRSSTGSTTTPGSAWAAPLTLRHNSRLHHIGLGRRHAGIPVLVHDLHIRVLSTSGELLRNMNLDPSRDYQPEARK